MDAEVIRKIASFNHESNTVFGVLTDIDICSIIMTCQDVKKQPRKIGK